MTMQTEHTEPGKIEENYHEHAAIAYITWLHYFKERRWRVGVYAWVNPTAMLSQLWQTGEKGKDCT